MWWQPKICCHPCLKIHSCPNQDSLLPMFKMFGIRVSALCVGRIQGKFGKEKRLKEEESEKLFKELGSTNCRRDNGDGNENEKGERISRPCPVWEQVCSQTNKGKVWSWGKNGFDMVEEKYRLPIEIRTAHGTMV